MGESGEGIHKKEKCADIRYDRYGKCGSSKICRSRNKKICRNKRICSGQQISGRMTDGGSND